MNSEFAKGQDPFLPSFYHSITGKKMEVKEFAENRDSHENLDTNNDLVFVVQALALFSLIVFIVIIFSGCKSTSIPTSPSEYSYVQREAYHQNEFSKLLGTYWYGIYFQNNKIGFMKVVIELDEKRGIYLANVDGVIKMKFAGRIIENSTTRKQQFESSSPYNLIEYTEKTESRDNRVEKVIVRKGDSYQAIMKSGGETQTFSLNELNYTLPISLSVENWLATHPSVGSTIKYPSIDMEELKLCEDVSTLKAIHSSFVSGVEMKYYEISTFAREKMKLTTIIGEDGIVYAFGISDLIQGRLEPEALATSLAGKRDKKTDYIYPCDCRNRSYPIICQTLTEYYQIDYNITEGDKPGELLLNGRAKITDTQHFYNVSNRDAKNRFFLYLFKNGAQTERIPLLRRGDRSSIEITGKIINKDFDAVILGYQIFVYN